MATATKSDSGRLAIWLRYGARGLALTVSSLWVLILMTAGLADSDGISPEGVLLAILVVAAFLSALYELRNERVGGWALIGTGTALALFALFTAGNNHWIAVSVTGLPLILSGSLLLAADYRNNPQAPSR